MKVRELVVKNMTLRKDETYLATLILCKPGYAAAQITLKNFYFPPLKTVLTYRLLKEVF